MADWAPKVFWSEVSVSEQEGGYGIALDGRDVKTPSKTALVLPTQALAELVAAEWRAQEEVVDPTVMPMTRMANSAIDRMGKMRADVVDHIAGYGETDLLCYRAESPRELRARQDAAWDPLLDWADERFGARLLLATGIMPVTQPSAALERLKAEVESWDNFGLMALHDLVGLSGSLVIGLAAAYQARALDELWNLSRIDESWQTEQWGIDEEAAELAETKATAFRDSHRFLLSSR